MVIWYGSVPESAVVGAGRRDVAAFGAGTPPRVHAVARTGEDKLGERAVCGWPVGPGQAARAQEDWFSVAVMIRCRSCAETLDVVTGVER
jgi:hypothetical protein